MIFSKSYLCCGAVLLKNDSELKAPKPFFAVWVLIIKGMNPMKAGYVLAGLLREKAFVYIQFPEKQGAGKKQQVRHFPLLFALHSGLRMSDKTNLYISFTSIPTTPY